MFNTQTYLTFCMYINIDSFLLSNDKIGFGVKMPSSPHSTRLSAPRSMPWSMILGPIPGRVWVGEPSQGDGGCTTSRDFASTAHHQRKQERSIGFKHQIAYSSIEYRQP